MDDGSPVAAVRADGQPRSLAPRPALAALLLEHEAFLRGFVARSATGLLLHETVEDLVQGVFTHALGVAGRFEYRGPAAFRGWLERVARQHTVNRHRYWKARRREAGALLRQRAVGLRPAASSASASALHPAAPGAGPSTLASRREELRILARAVDLLLPRDQVILRSVGEGERLEELAFRLGVTYTAAQRARRRAIERLERICRLLGLGAERC
jgi:RNA polymerase sigma factor (sigma-70 family)